MDETGFARAAGRAGPLALAVVLLSVGAVAWWLQLRPALAVEAGPLRERPLEVAGWQAWPLPVEQAVESMLQADLHLLHAYEHPLGELVWAYVGYYGTTRGGRPEHLPKACYRANGWSVDRSRVLSLGGPADDRGTVELVVRQGGETRLVHYWFRTHRRTGITNVLRLAWDHLLGRVLDARADGALVRLSTPVSDGDLISARSRLAQFGADFDAALGQHWPRERPLASDGRSPR